MCGIDGCDHDAAKCAIPRIRDGNIDDRTSRQPADQQVRNDRLAGGKRALKIFTIRDGDAFADVTGDNGPPGIGDEKVFPRRLCMNLPFDQGLFIRGHAETDFIGGRESDQRAEMALHPSAHERRAQAGLLHVRIEDQ